MKIIITLVLLILSANAQAELSLLYRLYHEGNNFYVSAINPHDVEIKLPMDFCFIGRMSVLFVIKNEVGERVGESTFRLQDCDLKKGKIIKAKQTVGFVVPNKVVEDIYVVEHGSEYLVYAEICRPVPHEDRVIARETGTWPPEGVSYCTETNQVVVVF